MSLKEKIKVVINLFSVHRMKDDDLKEVKDRMQRGEYYEKLEELDDNDEFPLVAREIGEITLQENSDTPYMVDVLYFSRDSMRTEKGKRVPLRIGSVYKTSLIQYVKSFEE